MSTSRKIAGKSLRILQPYYHVLKHDNRVGELTKKYRDYDGFLYRKKYNFLVVYESTLKLKEVSYIHAEGCGARGEMKHWPIAIIDPNFSTVAIAPRDSVYEKTVSNMEKIKARKSRILTITTEGNDKSRI